MRENKTNAMRILESWGVSYQSHQYAAKGPVDGVTVAQHLGVPPERVYKTLVTKDNKNQCYVFVIPCAHELDLKKAAHAVQAKSLSMLAVKELLGHTGYVRGGCSPVGMKKLYPTVIDQSAASLETFLVSAGKIGRQVEINPAALAEKLPAAFADVCHR